MILPQNLKSMKCYRTQCYLPTLDGDKKKGSAIVLLSPNYEASKSLMNNPLFVNNKRFESYYVEKALGLIINDKKVDIVEESYIEEAKRSDLPDSAFGLPDERKYPLENEQHVRSAIRLFGHCPESKKKELAKKISRRAKEYGIKIPETTQVYKYLHENVMLENDEFIVET